METLFREILATSPTPAPPATLYAASESASALETASRPEMTFEGFAGKGPGSLLLSGVSEDTTSWPSTEDLDLQRLIDLLPLESQPLDTWDLGVEAVGVY